MEGMKIKKRSGNRATDAKRCDGVFAYKPST